MPNYGAELVFHPRSSNWIRHNEWRWNRVLELVDTRDAVPSPPGDDQWIVGGYRFLTALKIANGDPAEQRSIQSRWPALYGAYELRTAADPIVREGVNSLLKQRNQWGTVVRDFNESMESISWYVKLWMSDFDPASNRPNTPLYNSLVQNSEALSPSYSAYNLAAYLSNLAFGYQPDTLWDVLENRELSEEAHVRFMSAYNSMLAHKSLRAVSNVQPNSHHAVEVMGHYLDVHKTKRELDLQEQTQGGAMADLVNFIINGANWRVMNRGIIPPELHQAEPKALPAPDPKVVKAIAGSKEK